MKTNIDPLSIVGGGLAGCEAAWQAAQAGIDVNLYEMRPLQKTEAHLTDSLAELVCSNSLGSTLRNRPAGLLKEECKILRSLLVECAEASALPAGDALAGRRVAYLAKGLRHAALCAAMQKAAAEHKAGTGDIEEVRAALLRLVAFRRETEPDLIANIGHLYDWETRHWNIPRVLQGIPKEAVAEAMAAGGAGGLGGTAAVAEAAAESSDCGATFTILLKEDATIDRLRFFNRAPAGGCRGFRVAVSADGRSFTTVLSADLRQAERPDEAQEFAVPPAAGRYLKLEILSGYEKKASGLGEFEAYEGTRNVAALAAGAELVRWSSDYGSYDFFAYTPKHLLDGVPSTVWLSSPVPVPCE